MKRNIYFAIPGNIKTLTGGYGYDRRLISELTKLGHNIIHIPLASSFPEPDKHALADAERKIADLPTGAILLADGLAFGIMSETAERHADRLHMIALCHHPLAFETGLTVKQIITRTDSEKRAIAAAKAVLVTSATTGDILAQQFAVPISKITVARPGTDTQSFADCINECPVLLTVATLTPRKAHDVLIDALTQVTDLRWVARFVGGADFNPEWTHYLRNKVHDNELTERIIFVGNVDDLTSEYSQADVFILPSHFEGYGMAFAEALSYGLPVIAANTGAVPQVVPVTAGIFVLPNDANALADAVKNILTNRGLRSELQKGAKDAAENLPSWTDTAKVVSELINKF